MHSGLVFNIQKYSVHDGPGIRTTVFLKGCPLRCAWCHNPESITPRRELLIVESRCIACRECRLACRFGTLVPGDGPLPARSGTCVLCGDCVAACPTEARALGGDEMSVARVLKIVSQDRMFYEQSGGGVTFSGGEPLLQPEFLRSLLETCHAGGLHTVVDTCGMASWEHLLAIAPVTDLFLYDIKLMDDARHRQWTGVSNALILQNLEALGRVHQQIWLRIPLIPGVNDDPAELEAIARFAASVPSIRQVNVLPYHRNGAHKAKRLGQDSALADTAPPSAETITNAVGLFQRHSLATKAGG